MKMVKSGFQSKRRNLLKGSFGVRAVRKWRITDFKANVEIAYTHTAAWTIIDHIFNATAARDPRCECQLLSHRHAI